MYVLPKVISSTGLLVAGSIADLSLSRAGGSNVLLLEEIPSIKEGYGEIRTDSMDVVFESYRIVAEQD